MEVGGDGLERHAVFQFENDEVAWRITPFTEPYITKAWKREDTVCAECGEQLRIEGVLKSEMACRMWCR